MKYLVSLIAALMLLLPAAAFADFEFWDWDSVSGEFEDDAPRRIELSGDPVNLQPHGLVEGVNYGMYFGAGDEFIMGGAQFMEGAAQAGHSGHGNHVPRGNYLYDFGDFGYDNIYGPMWGVPTDAFWGSMQSSLIEAGRHPGDDDIVTGADPYYGEPLDIDQFDDWLE